MKFIRNLEMPGLLSFPPGMPPFELHDLNVLIGPNGSGKSNIIETIDLLRATPTDFAAAIREGGGATEWFWKGETTRKVAKIEVETGDTNTGLTTTADQALRYRLEFTTDNMRVEVVDEAIEEVKPRPGYQDPYFYYRFQRGNPEIKSRIRNQSDVWSNGPRRIQRKELRPDQSVLAQIRDPELYPELTWLGRQLGGIQTLRDWTFGRYTASRLPQPADLPENRLLPDCRNLALILNEIEQHQVWLEFNKLLKRFFPDSNGCPPKLPAEPYSSPCMKQASGLRFLPLASRTARSGSSRFSPPCWRLHPRLWFVSTNRSWVCIRTPYPLSPISWLMRPNACN